MFHSLERCGLTLLVLTCQIATVLSSTYKHPQSNTKTRLGLAQRPCRSKVSPNNRPCAQRPTSKRNLTQDPRTKRNFNVGDRCKVAKTLMTGRNTGSVGEIIELLGTPTNPKIRVRWDDGKTQILLDRSKKIEKIVFLDPISEIDYESSSEARISDSEHGANPGFSGFDHHARYFETTSSSSLESDPTHAESGLHPNEDCTTETRRQNANEAYRQRIEKYAEVQCEYNAFEREWESQMIELLAYLNGKHVNGDRNANRLLAICGSMNWLDANLEYLTEGQATRLNEARSWVKKRFPKSKRVLAVDVN